MRIRLFEDVASRTPLIRLVWRSYELVRGTVLSRLMLGCYVLAAYLKLRVPRLERSGALAIAVYPNEVQEIKALARLLAPLSVHEIRCGTAQVLAPGSFGALRRSLRMHDARRILRLMARLERSHHFVSICRSISVLGFYARLQRELALHPPAAVALASITNPEALALVAAARKLGIPSVFSSHATMAPGSPVLPTTDIVLVDGPASLHRNRLPDHTTAVFKGLPGAAQPLQLERLDGRKLQVGIFLSAPVNEKGLEAMVAALPSLAPIEKIVIRPHPTAMLSPDLSWITGSAASVTLSSGVPLAVSLAGCGLVISGNSSVHLEALKAGVPTVYSPALDLLEDDYYEFVARNIVPRADPIASLRLESVAAFYGLGWVERFREFDPGYLNDPEAFREALKDRLRQLIAGWSR